MGFSPPLVPKAPALGLAGAMGPLLRDVDPFCAEDRFPDLVESCLASMGVAVLVPREFVRLPACGRPFWALVPFLILAPFPEDLCI